MERRAVSPVIAVVLMIAVAVAISVIVYVWSSGFVSKRSSVESAESEQLIIEELNLSGTQLTIYLRNKIGENAIADVIYVNGQLRASNVSAVVSMKTVTQLDLSTLISSNGGDGAFHVGDTVLIVTLRGTQIRFTVR